MAQADPASWFNNRPHSVSVHPAFLLQVRPYTVRRGDTLESIAKKRELDVVELQKLNHDVSPGQRSAILPSLLSWASTVVVRSLRSTRLQYR